MAQETFLYPATKPLFNQLEQLSARSGVSRGQAFEDFLIVMTATLAGQTMEDEYLAMVKRHTKGKVGRRGCDLFQPMAQQLIAAMMQEETIRQESLKLRHRRNQKFNKYEPITNLNGSTSIQYASYG